MKSNKTKQNVKIAVIVTLLASAVSVLDFFRIKNYGSACVSKALFGVSCPACGMTRAFLSVLTLNFRMAFYYNPAWWTVPLMALACLMTFLDKKRTKLWVTVFSAGVVILIGTWIFRLATGTTV